MMWFWAGVAMASLCGLSACGSRSALVYETDGASGALGSAGAQGAGGGGGGGSAGDSGVPTQFFSRKLDLLLVIDNSRSMGEKQAVLRSSVTTLISRLTNPRCLLAGGEVSADQPATKDQPCPPGSSREMTPVSDMHIGMITTSLGGHGGDTCSPRFDLHDPSEIDRAELITRGAVRTYQDRGYLVWDPDQKASPPGHASAAVLAGDVSALIAGAGEVGCGLESTLEAWYRFLIDPEPPEEVVVEEGTAVLRGTNQKVLTQRSQFLRPDSAVLIVMVSDENDCSIVDGDIGWIAAQYMFEGKTFNLPRATSECAGEPNDPCCRSCDLIESVPPPGCRALSDDRNCRLGQHDDLSDPLGLRCWDQKRRFGFDVLHPIERYVRGLTELTVPNRTGTMVPNPLFTDLTGSTARARHPSLVSVAAIVGVPWQDLARDPANSIELRYMSARELAAQDRWQTIIGDPGRGTPPLDPFMRESVDPRSGNNPITGDAIEPPSSSSATASPINGHEWVPERRSDLQFACTFPLEMPIDCSSMAGCDCSTGEKERFKPLCQAPDGSYGTRQYHAQAYPGIRQLELLSKLGGGAIAASICPRNIAGPGRPDYAYDPAVQAMVDRLSVVIH